ncbi:restriction endonuclease subunit S [Streptomyces sp. BB1-1-1]|uniref:restriction endonuclease subunit S n=1 Tax=Streptomyces sp. BB1-1-1 TaxID=3074430 RepID=UPI002877D881|nr:restriction endonuclease subunit S [Streptomyces sp. BB1-1-1]WND35388.1 restriction endonuclease subunit S [Streptomyces sp. BB1-1-1]
MSNWKRSKLGDLLKVHHGFAFAGEGMTDALTGRPIVVSIGNFNYSGGFRFSSTRVREFIGDYPPEFNLMAGDLLVVMTCQTAGGEILGVPGLVPDDGRVYLHNQRIGRIACDPSRMDKRFAYYAFLSREVNRQLFSTASGTKILHTSPGRIEQVEIDIPPLSEQKRIGELLGALDDKIAVNERIVNAAMELGAAKAAQVSASAMESAVLGDILELKYGKSLPAARRVAGEIPVFGSGGISGTHIEALLEGPGIIVGRKGTIGSVYWSEGGFFPIDTTFYVVCRGDGVSMEYVYFLLKGLGLEEMNSDSAVPGLNRDRALSVRIKVPDAPSIQRFTVEARELFAMLRVREQENQTLATLRDTLLPQLMSGRLRVKDAEKIVEDHV